MCLQRKKESGWWLMSSWSDYIIKRNIIAKKKKNHMYILKISAVGLCVFVCILNI